MTGRAAIFCVLLAAVSADSATGPSSAARADVQEVERAWLDAYERRDDTAMDPMLTDDFTITFSDGTVQTKQQVLAALRNARERGGASPRFHTEEVTVRRYGKTAILTGFVITERALSREESRYTDTYVWQNGRWRVAASHLSVGRRTSGPSRQ